MNHTDDLRPRILVLGHVTMPIIKAGGKPVNAGMLDANALEQLEQDTEIHGLLLTGGGDINPSAYGQRRHHSVYGVSDDRDIIDMLAIDIADDRGIPIMGICRGHQMLNVAFGGTLHQHIPSLPTTRIDHSGGHEHLVQAATGSRLDEAFQGQARTVVSIHHQAVDQVADGFVATGWSHDGIIESIESVEGWTLGVQFHPEMAHTWPSQQRIFDSFIAASAKFAGLPVPTPRAIPSPPAPQQQPARQLALVGAKKPAQFSPVSTSWRCGIEGIRFDEKIDYVDHMRFIHGHDIDGH